MSEKGTRASYEGDYADAGTHRTDAGTTRPTAPDPVGEARERGIDGPIPPMSWIDEIAWLKKQVLEEKANTLVAAEVAQERAAQLAALRAENERLRGEVVDERARAERFAHAYTRIDMNHDDFRKQLGRYRTALEQAREVLLDAHYGHRGYTEGVVDSLAIIDAAIKP